MADPESALPAQPLSAQLSLQPLRPFLKNWVWEHGQVGTRYFHCADGVVAFDDGRKARFAADPVFYVSLKRDADDAAHQAGPVIHDGGLARFVHAAQFGKPEAAGSPADIQRAVQDSIDLGLICSYQQDASAALARYALEAMFEDEIRAAGTSDIRAKYLSVREQLALYDYAVLYNLPESLLINEAPLIDWRKLAKPPQPFLSLPLGPNALLVGTPSGKKSRAGPVTWKAAANMGPFADHNRHIVNAARSWLVATTEAQLVAVQGRFLAPAA